MLEVRILPAGKCLTVEKGANLRKILQTAGVHLDAPCHGTGKCGKCAVLLNGQKVLACQTSIEEDSQIEIPESRALQILHTGTENGFCLDPLRPGHLIAVDIGTTSVVCYLLDGRTGKELAVASALNPQTAYGADVVSRIQAALAGALVQERDAIRRKLTELILETCSKAGVAPTEISVVSVVGNPSMQQLFLGLPLQNLAAVPFAPVLTEAKTVSCREILPICSEAVLLIVPDIAGYIGADTVACVLSTKMYAAEEITLMVDIGTNGEMVLGNEDRMIACSTAAGPALEGTNIRFGMRGTLGAIDHVWLEDGKIRYSVIGDGKAQGICGSGLIDAVAVLLKTGRLNKRGCLQTETKRGGERVAELTEDIYLTQDDIRQVQTAKGAIRAGIQLMAQYLDIQAGDIRQVLLAGAFGSYMDPASACRIDLLPSELIDRIQVVGNAAGSGARMLALDKANLALSQKIRDKIEFLELATLPEFSGTFARCMGFREDGK